MLGGYLLPLPCNSVDSGESKLNDFIRRFSFCRRGECGAALLVEDEKREISINVLSLSHRNLRYERRETNSEN